jgi:hypothetical protein
MACRSRRSLLLLAAAVLAVAAPASASAHPTTSLGACSPDVDLLRFSDALNKTTFQDTSVGGLSGISLTRQGARAIVDNQGTTNARYYDLALNPKGPKVTGVTTLRRPDGTPFTGQDFDGEGLVALKDGTTLVSSETEPVVRRFSRDGRQIEQLPVPDRFGVAPAGQSTTNLTFEGLGLSPSGRTLWVGMEGPLAPDGTTAAGGARLRFLRYELDRHGHWRLAGQVGYVADPGLGVSELQVVDDGELLVLERGFTAGVGNTVRVYQAFLKGADDVSAEPTLDRDGLHLVSKRLLADIGDCPTAGATSPGTQRNPLLDNIEGMAIGDRLPGGRRLLYLISDDNFSAGQVTRLYSFSARFPDEPVLEGRALYPAAQMQPGPTSGNVGVGATNGQTPPFAGQPIPGISGAVDNGDGTFWGQPDNGFGSKDNSADFLLRIYRFAPHYRTRSGGSGKLEVKGFITLRDPDRRIPFAIVNDATKDRLLTGADFDIESLQRTPDGTFWIGDEFGPFLLHVDRTGRLLQAPIPLPGAKAPQNPTLAPGEAATVRSSRGFEAVALSRNGRTLYPILEASLTTDADPTIRHVYEFDVASRSYTGRQWTFHAGGDDLQIGDAQVTSGRRIVFIERDDLEGPAAQIKDIDTIDLDSTPDADGTLRKAKVFDALRIRDPFGISTATGPAGAFGLGDPYSFPIQSFETLVLLGGDRVLIANDNNFPDSNGRIAGRPDDLEADVLEVPALGP